MPDRQEVAEKLREFIRDVKFENQYEAYMGIYDSSSWVFDAPDGRKYARVLQGSSWTIQPCNLLDTNIADDENQAVWVEYMREGRWAITRIRIEGY